jgi:hypothetical protein
MRLLRLSFILAAFATLLFACGGDDSEVGESANIDAGGTPDSQAEQKPPGPPEAVDTEVDPSSIRAGDSVSVRCSATDADGQDVEVERYEIGTDPVESVSLDGDALTFKKAGTYEVRCAIADGGISDLSPAVVEVLPGAVITLALVFDPDQKSYPTDKKVTVRGTGLDANGNTVENLAVTITKVEPDGHHKILGDAKDGITFDESNVYTITAVSVDNDEIDAARSIIVDAEAPIIEITEPERGITTDGDQEVTVKGTVSDNLGKVAWLEVNGQKLNVPEAGGEFETTVALTYGVNIIHVRAADPGENIREVGRAVMWSSRWLPLDPPAMDTDLVKSAVVVELGQDAVDDGVHDPNQLNDLATLFEVIVGGLNLNELIPDPIGEFKALIGNDMYQLRLTEITFDKPAVTLRLIDGGIYLKISLANFKARVQLKRTCDTPVLCDPINTTMSASSIVVETDIAFTVVAGEAMAQAQNTKVEINDLDVALEGIAGFLVNWIPDLLRDQLTSLMEGLITDQLETQLTDMLSQLFEALQINEKLDIPALIGEGATNSIQLILEPGQMRFTPEVMRMDLDGLVYADNDPPAEMPLRPDGTPQTVLGSISYAGCGPGGQPPSPPPSPVLAAAHDDFVNQLLFAVWKGGTLKIEAAGDDLADLDLSKYGVKDLALKVSFLLPPMLNSCGDGTNRVQLGDGYLEAQLKLLGQPLDVAFWLQAETVLILGTSVNEDGETELGFELGDLDPLIMEVARNEGMFAGNDQGLLDLIKGQLLPMLLEQLTGGLGGFAIPSIDLSSISDQLPEGATLNIDIQGFDRNGAYLLLLGGLK